ncbi:MAG: carbamoyl-phosphate synthase (glutamine-hydrolyzing) large subunit [archaeon]
MNQKIKKVLLLGSGAIKIGEAGEFDYSGSQAIKALKEEGLEVILINPNIATIQTSKGFSDKIYFLPVNAEFVEKIIEKEKPQGILLSFGGQTALNCGLELHKKGILEKHNVKVLGTPVEAIEKTEDRELFKKALGAIDAKTPKSFAVSSVSDSLNAAEKIKYPVMVRAAFALGGKGSGVAKNEKELKEIAEQAFSHSSQILVEEYLGGWKEIEYEVVRDSFDNCITVCNMENFDPLGIHTGESIVIAPSQTLNNAEYHMLRDISIRVIRSLGIVGECNIQFALDTKSTDYRIIEVNARLSRSSALASKATGYPLAFIAAKLALGYSLVDLQNQVTKKTFACFEPALDYCVIKIPRWDLQKFRKVGYKIGSEMKSVGEVMAIGRNFEETMQKALRMLNIGVNGLVANDIKVKDILQTIEYPTDWRVYAIIEAIEKDVSLEKINKLSGIDLWFLTKLKNVVDLKKEISNCSIETIPKDLLLKAKQFGFSDKQLAIILNCKDEFAVREKRELLGIKPVTKQIDTLAAEFPAMTNYLYMTYNGTEDDIERNKSGQVLVIGSGPYSIGSSVEFDWCCVTASKRLNKLGYDTIMVNSNPETVSTDYDMSNRLYFEELSLERILDIYEKESPLGIIVSMGGQIPNTLSLKLHNAGARILGTAVESIDKAEDRNKFSELCDSLNIPQPAWKELKTESEAIEFANKVNYPVLVRPSYVLSGAAMSIAFNAADLNNYLNKSTFVSRESPVVISKFITNAKEIEIDAVASQGEIISYVINEHIENAGVHSGDATMVIPPQKLYLETVRKVKNIARILAKSLEITGPFNIQFIAKDNNVMVIECNLRASRSFPFISKVSDVNFIELATDAIMGKKLDHIDKSTLDLDYVAVKAPQFSFSRLKGADPLLGVEMSSTGEVACLGNDLEEAFLKALIATGFKMPNKNILLTIGGEDNRIDLLEEIKTLNSMGFTLYATEHTSEFLDKYKIQNKRLHKMQEHKDPNISEFISNKKIDLVICIAQELNQENLERHYDLRRLATDFNVPLITNKQIARLFITSINSKKLADLEVTALDEYIYRQ